ncbi:MAG: hypothetical protein A4S09_01665 [Proteobacteria bacterium SG_bin7]|nr:MAG: hypothetical protein A4S09_01665 [Proteobacteria bacterium SG_bin7]
MIEEIINSHKVLVCAGSGGVGKTTLAAALGLKAAQIGKKVLVLTIDPSKRLGTSLGISRSGGGDVLVPDQKVEGELYAAVLNSKLVFDNFVREAVQNQELAEKFMKNRLYIQLSTKLSASQEFTALERLYSSVDSKKYDLVILDTPPAKHAIDFLRSPQKINSMFQKSVTEWFIRTHNESKSFFSRFSATQQILNVFRKITGSNFIDELVEFFTGIEAWQQKVQDRTIEVHKLLVSESTGFVMVSSFDENKLREGVSFAKELKKGGHHLSAVIINRAFPLGLRNEESQIAQKSGPENTDIVARLLQYYEKYLKFYEERLNVFEELKANLSEGTAFLQIPDFNQDVGNIRDLERLSNVAFK